MKKLQLDQVPVSIRRRAFQQLESMRGTPMAVGTEKSRIADSVVPIMRPDIKDVAYYEFEVTTRSQSEDSKNQNSGKGSLSSGGFIMVSTGTHDFPVPHFSFERPPVSHELEILAQDSKTNLSVILKMDALCYVGEDESGNVIGKTGQIPPLIRAWPDRSQMNEDVASSTDRPSEVIHDDNGANDKEHNVKSTGAKSGLEIWDPEDWAEYKKNYHKSFGPLLANLSRKASEDWRVINFLDEFGEGIYTGESHFVALLESKAKINLSGDGAQYVTASQIERTGAPPVLELKVSSIDISNEIEFKLQILYSSGLEEVLSFFLVSKDTPSNTSSSGYQDIFEIKETSA